MKKALKISLLSLCVLALGSHFYFSYSTEHVLNNYHKKEFHLIENTHLFEETKPVAFFGKTKAPKAVLFLHSYKCSPYEYKDIFKELEKKNIPYYAPLFFGHGLNTYRYLKESEEGQWLKETLLAYDLLSKYAEKIDVVGFSNGGALAVLLANKKPVNRLVLLAPDLFPAASTVKLKKLIESPVAGPLLEWIMPVIPDNLGNFFAKKENQDQLIDKSSQEKAFFYHSFGLKSLKALWDVQDAISLKQGSLQTEKIDLIYAAHDQRVDSNKTIEALKLFHPKIYGFNTTHDLLIDKEREHVFQTVIEILTRDD